jgi:hypothetical protein
VVCICVYVCVRARSRVGLCVYHSNFQTLDQLMELSMNTTLLEATLSIVILISYNQ